MQGTADLGGVRCGGVGEPAAATAWVSAPERDAERDGAGWRYGGGAGDRADWAGGGDADRASAAAWVIRRRRRRG